MMVAHAAAIVRRGLAVLAVAALGALVPEPAPAVAKADTAARGAAAAGGRTRPAAARSEAAFDSTVRDLPGEPQLYLSWRAPYGMPGASDTIAFVAGDTSRVDTLYLSFESGGDGPSFHGMWARLYFHPQSGDTLGPYWRYNSGERNWGNLRIQSDPDETFPCAQPWIHNGVGQPLYDFDPGGSRLDFAYVILRDEDAIPLAGRTRYCFARVLFHHNEWQLPGSRQPVCIEWSEARLSFGGREITARRGAQRLVAVNSPDGRPCAPFRRSPKPRPWRPEAPSPPKRQP